MMAAGDSVVAGPDTPGPPGALVRQSLLVSSFSSRACNQRENVKYKLNQESLKSKSTQSAVGLGEVALPPRLQQPSHFSHMSTYHWPGASGSHFSHMFADLPLAGPQGSHFSLMLAYHWPGTLPRCEPGAVKVTQALKVHTSHTCRPTTGRALSLAASLAPSKSPRLRKLTPLLGERTTCSRGWERGGEGVGVERSDQEKSQEGGSEGDQEEGGSSFRTF